jgi:hypothetical protein
MKTLLISLILLFSISIVKSQKMILLGYTFEEMKKQMPNESFKIFTATNGAKIYSMMNSYGYCIYEFDSKGVCNFCSLMVFNMDDITNLINSYNSDCKVISPYHWHAQLEGGFVDIKLVHVEGGSENAYKFEYK